MHLTKHDQILMRMALGEYRDESRETAPSPMLASDLPAGAPHLAAAPSRQYHNRITVWRNQSDSTRVMRQLARKGWAREQESTEKQITYGITPNGVRALVEQLEA